MRMITRISKNHENGKLLCWKDNNRTSIIRARPVKQSKLSFWRDNNEHSTLLEKGTGAFETTVVFTPGQVWKAQYVNDTTPKWYCWRKNLEVVLGIRDFQEVFGDITVITEED